MIRVAPGDLSWLYSRCRRCYWDKLHKVSPVKEPFANVLRTTAGATELALTVENLLKLGVVVDHVAEIPSVKSRPVAGAQISGRPDKVFTYSDGSLLIIDAKCATMSDTLFKYERQLSAYAYAIEHPEAAEPRRVREIALVVFEPVDRIAITWKDTNDAAILGKMKYLPMSYDPAKVEAQLRDIAKLFESPPPPTGLKCDICIAVEARAQALARNEGARAS